MNLSAVKIAEQILQKTAVSRWREAIYSGELPLEQREQLKAHMGATPGKYIAGNEKGIQAQLKRLGVKVQDIPGMLSSSNPGSTNIVTTVLKGLKQQYEGGTGAAYTPWNKTIRMPPREDVAMQLGMGAVMSDNPRVQEWMRTNGTKDSIEELASVALRHETAEASADAKRARTGRNESLIISRNPKAALPSKIQAIRGAGVLGGLRGLIGQNHLESAIKQVPIVGPLYQDTGNVIRSLGVAAHGTSAFHNSPSVVLDELRSSRMLSPQTQNIVAGMRDRAGEFESFANTPDWVPSDLVVKREDIPAYTKKILEYNRNTPAGKTQQLVNRVAQRAERAGSSVRGLLSRFVR